MSTDSRNLKSEWQNESFSPSNFNMKYPSSKVLMNLTNLAKYQNAVKKSIPNVVTIFSKKNYSSGKSGGKLLKYPAFKLEDTMAKFLRSTRPLLTDDEYAQTENAVKSFIEKDGKELQGLLEKEAEKSVNWLAPRWLQVAYLQYRAPLTVFSNPCAPFPLTPFASQDEWLLYAANLINGMAQFKRLIDEGKLPTQKMGKFELDNSQFYRIFGTNRRPSRPEDQLSFYPESKHAVIIYKNHFFKIPVLTDNCEPIAAKLIKEGLESIVAHKQEFGVEYGILTTDNRDNWTEAYEVLKKQPGNDKILCAIETALFTVSLDQCVEYWSDRAWEEQARQGITAGGSKQNAANRWMDKTIQLIVNRNGFVFFTYEHSPAEGQGIAMIIDFVIAKMKASKCLEGAEPEQFCVDYLRFADANPCIEQWISVAKRNVDSLNNRLDIFVLQYDDFGKDFIKKNKFSPDSFVQIAIQFAFYRLHKEAGAQYESAHLRIFDGGRTETIRSCSIESVEFAKAMLDSSTSVEERCIKLHKAIHGHREYTNNALQGKAVDRHLFGLKLMAIENGKPIPEFFCCPGYVKSTHFRISTSQVASLLPVVMSYGPITNDGYACCYNPRDCDILLACSSWKGEPSVSAEKWANAISDSLDDMKGLCSQNCDEFIKKAKDDKGKKSADAPKSKL